MSYSGLFHRLSQITSNFSGQVRAPHSRRTAALHYEVDAWSSFERFNQMTAWCQRNVKGADWDYQTNFVPILGDGNVELRFYFASAADAAAFGKEFLS